jgi:hypothetical protein
MPKYKGKRVNVTFPVEVYEQITELASDEIRTVSQMVVVLCREAMLTRGENHRKIE